MGMFCFQCQEAAKGIGCTIKGACGKSEDVAKHLDLLVYLSKGISVYTVEARNKGLEYAEINKFILDALFTSITNANFDKQAIVQKLKKGYEMKLNLANDMKSKGISIPEKFKTAAEYYPASEAAYLSAAETISVLSTPNEDVRSLRELLVYGIKGMAAYAEHALNLGFEDNEIHTFIQKGLVSTLNNDLQVPELIDLVMDCGKFGVNVMALLDKANTTAYGHPEITKVNIGVRKNPGILISGHDLKDLQELLEQTEGTGIDVYTHSEMLPGHYYPAFKKYKHFVGNYGSSWWHQKEDFETFNGPILFTTNCIVPPATNSTYKDRVYTTGSSGHEGFKHIADRPKGGKKDFSAIIAHAAKCQTPKEIETGEIIGGFAHNQVFTLADKVIEAVKSGAIKKFFVMAGCDGRMKDRDYYTQFAENLPKDTVILTAGCAKYRYNKLPLGDIGGIPRVLDAGQCNDSYSLAVVALKLKEVFQLNDINELPIAYNIAWYEQKAVIVLLALLYLGVKKIHLGPTLPAFLSPNVAKVLVEQFGIAGIQSVDEDIKLFMS